jgi:hypothetical protein
VRHHRAIRFRCKRDILKCKKFIHDDTSLCYASRPR